MPEIAEEDRALIDRAFKLHGLAPGPESAQEHTGEADPVSACFVTLGEAKDLLGKLAARLQEVLGS